MLPTLNSRMNGIGDWQELAGNGGTPCSARTVVQTFWTKRLQCCLLPEFITIQA
jgi:hypothetical protein